MLQGTCPPKFKHLIIKKQKKDSSASCVVKGKLCVGLFFCVQEVNVLHVEIHLDILIGNL